MAKPEKSHKKTKLEREIEIEEREPILVNANKAPWGHRIWVWFQTLVFIGILVGGTWYYQQLQIEDLRDQKAEISKQLEDSKKAHKKTEDELAEAQKQLEAAGTTVTTVPPLLKQAVVTAVQSGKYAGLEPYLAEKISYTIAASSGQGTITKAQALKQLEYLNSGTSPWNFDISEDLLTKYKAGAYSQYLNDDIIFGTSGNKFFVSFRLDTNNKIDQFFIASSTDLL